MTDIIRGNNGRYLGKDIAEYLRNGSIITASHLRTKILKNGIKEHRCERCGRTEWEGEPIPLELHHINGNKMDNNIENLQILCPNCHALTDNYSGKKNKKEPKKCPICGKPIHKKSKVCEECYRKMPRQRIKQNIVRKNIETGDETIITKELLLEHFKKIGSFTGIGKLYGVSDKAVAKWFIRFGLPGTVKGLKNMYE